MTVTTYKWSIPQWHNLVDTGVLAGKPVELLDGEIIEMSPEEIPHTYTNQSVSDYLRDIFQAKALIRESHPVTLDNSPHSRASEPEPDIAIVKLPKTIYKEHHPYSEDIYLLIEISQSSLKLDIETKSQIYARNSIPEYWIIDLVNKKLIVHTQPADNNYLQIVEYKSGAILPQAFPNITITWDRLLLF